MGRMTASLLTAGSRSALLYKFLDCDFAVVIKIARREWIEWWWRLGASSNV